MRLIDADRFREYCIHKLNFFPAMIARALERQPTIETIQKGLYDQIKWERDVAIDQLKSYGIGLGEKADVKKVVHGKWFILDDCANDGVYCSECHKRVYKLDYSTKQKLKSNFCPNCGAKMDGEEV